MRQIIFFIFYLGSFINAIAQETLFRENTLILKIKPEYSFSIQNGKINLPEMAEAEKWLGVEKLFLKYPNASKPGEGSRNMPSQYLTKQVDITTIFEWQYTANIPVQKAINFLKNLNCFEYVEPAYIQEVTFVPNDDLSNTQYHLKNIKAFSAFDQDTGSSSITIGIVDTGTDWDHEDLISKIDYNESDPIDGVDNDGNGFVDDYRGWNLHDDNNDPNETSWSHGTHVAGLAAAATNNEIGVVGTGFSTKFLPIKAGSFAYITHGYEGIVYAANMGCKVINCSWGSVSLSDHAYDVIAYATYNKDAIILAGAGNDNLDTKFFPASYDEVMSVGGTDSLNHKYQMSNYGFTIDIMAPGTAIQSTKNDDTYDLMSGTSMSSPIVAGAAALVRHKYPQFTAMQVKAQLMATADKSLMNLPANEPFKEKFGSGLLDMASALGEANTPFVVVENKVSTDKNDNAFYLGETVYLMMDFVNYLDPTGNLTVTLSPIDKNQNIEMLDSTYVIGALNTNDRINNNSNPFTFKIVAEEGEYNQTLVFRVKITDGSYSTIDYIEVTLKPDYINVTVNNVSSTIANNGLIAFTDYFHSHGLGFRHNRFGDMLYEAGLMIGYESAARKQVTDRVRGEILADRDFTANIIIEDMPLLSNEAFRAEGMFVDTSATLDEIGLEIYQTATAFNDDGHRDYFIVQYDIVNSSGSDLNGIYAGYFADWDISNPSTNKAKTELPLQLGYVQNIGANEYSAGIQLLSSAVFNSYMIDNDATGSGGVNLNDANRFTSEEKYTTLTQSRPEAGLSENGNDVIQVIATEAQNLATGDTLSVKFAFLAAINPDSLKYLAEQIYQRETGAAPGQNIDGEFALKRVYPVPASGKLNIDFEIKSNSIIDFYVHDIAGRKVSYGPSQNFYKGVNKTSLDISKLNSGIYFITMKAATFENTFKIEKVK